MGFGFATLYRAVEREEKIGYYSRGTLGLRAITLAKKNAKVTFQDFFNNVKIPDTTLIATAPNLRISFLVLFLPLRRVPFALV